MRRLLALLLCCAVLAACGGGSDSDSDGSKTLKSVLLQLSDFPPSWRAYPATGATVDLLSELAACTGDRHPGRAEETVRSVTFRNGQRRIESTGVWFGDQGKVSARIPALGNRKADPCIARVMESTVRDAVAGARIVRARYQVTPGAINVPVNVVGTASGVVTVDANGTRRQVYVDIVFITGRYFYTYATFLGVGQRLPDYVRRSITDDIATRAQHT